MYLKGGIITRIDCLDNNFFDFVDISFYEKVGNNYILNSSFFSSFICEFRHEILSVFDGKYDSIDSVEGYYFDISGDKLLDSSIKLIDDGRGYLFGFDDKVFFDTEFVYDDIDGNRYRIYFIPIIWVCDNILISSCYDLLFILNSFVKKTLTNPLKDCFFFTFC